MRVLIHSHDSIEKTAKKPFAERTAVIGVDDTDSEPPELAHKPDYMLRLVFDDVSAQDLEECDEERRAAFTLFSREQARRIAEFVYEHKAVADVFICQCFHGESRSAAIAAAILEHFDRRGIDIFADDRYCPSRHVFRTLLEALKRERELHG